MYAIRSYYGALFNLLAIGGIVALVRKSSLTWQPMVRDIAFYFVAVVVITSYSIHYTKLYDGMGGALDSARFKYRIAEALDCPQSDVSAMVIGAHSDTGMVPLIEKAVRNSVLVSEFLSAEKMAEVVEATKVGGATLTKLLGTSAWYAPGAAVSELVRAIALDSKKMFPCSALLEGEYGQTDISLGVPCILGKNGIEKIVEISLSDAEKAKFDESAEAVKAVNAML